MTDKLIQYRFQAAQVLIREAGIFALEWFRNPERLNPQKKGAGYMERSRRSLELFHTILAT